MSDVLTKAQRSKNMKRIRCKDTKIERILRNALWAKGIRYRKNASMLPGKPDIVLAKYKIAIFCDGEFFHGKNWDIQHTRILKGENGQFWVNKISKNIERDNRVDIQLRSMGWVVLRFWGNDIQKNLEQCIQTIEEAIFDRKMELNKSIDISTQDFSNY